MGHLSLISGLGRSPGEGHGKPLQYSCLENPQGQRSLLVQRIWIEKSLWFILCLFPGSVSMLGICGQQVWIDVICTTAGTIRGSPSPPKGTPGYFHSPSFIIIPHYLSCILGVIMHFEGTILAVACHKGTMQCAEAVIYKTPSGEQGEMELGKGFFFCTGACRWWGLNWTISLWHKSIIYTKEPFFFLPYKTRLFRNLLFSFHLSYCYSKHTFPLFS